MSSVESGVDEFGLPSSVDFEDDDAVDRLDRLFRVGLDLYNLGLNRLAHPIFERLARADGDGVPPGLTVASGRMARILHPDTSPEEAAEAAVAFFTPRILVIRPEPGAAEPPAPGPDHSPPLPEDSPVG
jgi:hypothetical protein